MDEISKERCNYSSGSLWEPLRGYSRAVRVGNHLYVSGTTAVDEKGDVLHPNDPYEQTRQIISFLKTVLATADFKISDVIRTRLFVTNIAKWDDYARAHREAFEHIRPVSSIVQIARLVDPRLTIEMECEAIRGLVSVDDVSIKR